MTPQQQELWQRIVEFPLDDLGAELTFSKRLARDNGWSHAYALRVADEYKRFAFLAMCAGHHVTPSDDVDQAWHLHLVYTRSYWEVFCPKVLGKPLHHGPTVGGEREGDKFHDWYSHTMASYLRFFEEEAPADIWPDPKTRFGEAAFFRRVNTRKNLVLPIPRFRFWAGGGLAALFLILTVAGCSVQLSNPGFLPASPDYGILSLFSVLWAACVVAGIAIRQSIRRPSRDHADLASIDPTEIGYLAGGARRAGDSALATLAAQDMIKLSKDFPVKVWATNPPHEFLAPFEARLCHLVGSQSSYDIKELRSRIARQLEPVRDRLVERDLIVPEGRQRLARFLPLGLALIVPLIGLFRVVAGLIVGQPFGFMLVFVFLATPISFWLFWKPPLRTAAGDRVFADLRRRFPDFRRLSPNPKNPTNPYGTSPWRSRSSGFQCSMELASCWSPTPFNAGRQTASLTAGAAAAEAAVEGEDAAEAVAATNRAAASNAQSFGF